MLYFILSQAIRVHCAQAVTRKTRIIGKVSRGISAAFNLMPMPKHLEESLSPHPKSLGGEPFATPPREALVCLRRAPVNAPIAVFSRRVWRERPAEAVPEPLDFSKRAPVNAQDARAEPLRGLLGFTATSISTSRGCHDRACSSKVRNANFPELSPARKTGLLI